MKKFWNRLSSSGKGLIKGAGIGVFITAGLIAVGVPVPVATTAGQSAEQVYEHIQEGRRAGGE